MPIVDRMEFPRKYKLNEGMVVIVIIAALAGIWLQRQSIRQASRKISINSVSVLRSGSSFIELEYSITNNAAKPQDIRLMARVWDDKDIELASALFEISLAANSTSTRQKLLDKLNRSLNEGERPYRCEISVYERKVP